MTNRRVFLGLLAHLPLVGAMFKGCGPESEPPVALTNGKGHWMDYEAAGQPIILDKPDMEYREVASFMWIPLKERLPGSNRWVLVCDCAARIIWVSGIDPAWEDFEKWVRENHVTHWMDLPPVPRSATDDTTGITEFTNPAITFRDGHEYVVLDGHMRVEAVKASGFPVEMEFWN